MSDKTKFSAAIEVITEMETNLEMTLKKKDAFKKIILAMAEIIGKSNTDDSQEIFNLLSKLVNISENPLELKTFLTQFNAYKGKYNEDINNNLDLICRGLAELTTASMHKSQKDSF